MLTASDTLSKSNASSKSDTLSRCDSLEALQSALDARSMVAGWTRTYRPNGGLQQPSSYVPAHWSYADAKAAMIAAGRLIGTDRAERRNFILRNPSDNSSRSGTLRTLVGAYQSILPGEKARSHRHCAHALRVILESRGSYSVVDGVKHPMESGDVVLTPGWSWHAHGHDGTEQAFWFDGLDVPLATYMERMYNEDHPSGGQDWSSEVVHSPMRFAWSDTLASLDRAPKDEAGHFGRTITLPAETMPTISLKVHGWTAGWRNRPYRQTVNTIYAIMKGSGRTTIGQHHFDWTFGDVIAAPAWHRIEHHATSDAVVFAMSDEALTRWMRYYQFEALE